MWDLQQAPKQILSIWVKQLHPREEIESIGKERERKQVYVAVCCVSYIAKRDNNNKNN